ncbi:peptidoglycan bridge formation glycyltransferase FemA/FemB family protein [Candidatus Falkowbacteria bacterium]|nr:peptidoglycan bridge formation glycyltransferase FemA/FemB family protein [Candidatus Falkowbacteria bacterium]
MIVTQINTIQCDELWREKWDEFVKNNSLDFGLLQSWVWGEFQKSLGKKVFRLAVIDENENILAAASVIKNNLKLGKSYFYVPRGPVMSLRACLRRQGAVIGDEAILSQLKLTLDCFASLAMTIKHLAKKENVIFLRLEPAWGDNKENKKILSENKFQFIGQVQPKQTLILDLRKSEEELLKQMKPKTRYNIKVAQNHGIIINEGENYFADFWRLMEHTSERGQFISQPKEYYQKMLTALGDEKNLKLIIAKSENKVIAANLVIFFGKWCVYLHGASDYEYRSKMAPYLLQWQAILEAKKIGGRYYDFWGVDGNKWPGITRFKQGFAPQDKFINYVGAWDEVYSRFWYNLYRMFK